MPPKQKILKLEKSGKKRNKSDSESSSSSMVEVIEADLEIAQAFAAPRATRASARACKAKNRDHSMIEATLKIVEKIEVARCDYDFHKLRTSDAYVQPSLYRKMEPEDFNMDYYNRNGLSEVLMFNCPPEKLGMKMVDENFTVRDVEKLVGGDKMITCVEVASQNSKDMPLKEFIDYYYTPKEEKKILYNVLSLEFSNTGLADHVRSPSLVREIDWASTWPDERKNRSVTFDKDGKFTVTNHFPRVENYCLMSPTECYTDFHVDFHGTSVWYHVKKGMKIFWIVEPTEQNLKMYEEFLKASHHNYFFGDVPEKCARVEVMPGNTLIIPSGWIHSVFTPCDSLVFGGNFLHSRQAMMQLNVLQGENRIGINKKYRYPYSEEMVFFYLNNILKNVTGRQYIRPQSRNQQDEYREYIGKLFEEKGGHRRIPKLEDYGDDGIVWEQEWEETADFIESQKKLAKWDKEEKKEEENGEKVKEESSNGKDETVTEDENASKMNDTNLEKEEVDQEKEEAKENCSFGGHYDFFIDDFTLYHPASFNLDAGTGATAMHTLPLSHNEPKEMAIDKDVLREAIHPDTVPQLEGLIVHYLKRPKVDLPIGLTRPNSLLQAFCTLLRERRILAEMDGNFTLPSCILPDQDGSRRLHEEQKAAAEERKRKYNEKKERAENGDGEYDSDWNPNDKEKPKVKKPRKSEDAFGKTVVSGEVKETKRERGVDAPKNLWNAGFCLWYRTDGKVDVDKHKPEFPGHKELKEFIRKTYYTPLDKKIKLHWMERAQAEWKKKGEKSDLLSSPSIHADLSHPSTSKDQFNPSSCMSPSSSIFGSEDMDMESPKKEIMTPHHPSSDHNYSASTSTIDPNIVRKKKVEVKLTEEETEEQKRWKLGGNKQKNGEMRPPSQSAPSTSNNGEQSMHHNLHMENMENGLNGVVIPPQSTLNDKVSSAVVRLLISKRPNVPRLFDYTDPNPFATPDQQNAVKMLKEHLRNQINLFCQMNLTLEDIENHVTLLKNSALQGNHLKGIPIPYLESITMVAEEMPYTMTPLIPGVASLISLKPVDPSLLMAQSEKMNSIVESVSKVTPSISRKENNVVKENSVIVEEEKNESIENGTGKKREERIESIENGREHKIEIKSDFRLAKADPKPPDHAEESIRETVDTVITKPTPHRIMNAKRRALAKAIEENEEKNDKEEEKTIEAPKVREMKTPMRGIMRRKEVETLICHSVPVKEVVKEEETDEDLLSNEELIAGNEWKDDKDSHWMTLKSAAENVIVRQFTENHEDWTPFDAFLRRNYKKCCDGFQREPSNSFALKIKREIWDGMIKEGGASRYESDAERFIREKRKRVYWKSETVVEQEDRIVEDRGLNVIPLGGEEKKEQEKTRFKSESSAHSLEIKQEDEYLMDEEDDDMDVDNQDDELIDVLGGVDDDIPLATIGVVEPAEQIVKEEEKIEIEEPVKKKGKGGRPKKEPVVAIKRKKAREEIEDFMQSGSTARGKAKKAKPDPNKPLIVDGVPVNPLAEPAVANAYGYDPAMDIVALGRGQLKSAYRRSKAQLDTPQIDVKRYKLEVKHDHLLDDDDHDDTHRDDAEVTDPFPRSTTPHGGDIMEGINVHTGDSSTIPPSQSRDHHQQPSPYHLQQRSSSFSRRPVHPIQQAPPLIPHAPSPLSARRISGAPTDGWGGGGGMNAGRRRSDGERRDRTSGNRSPSRKSSSHYSPADSTPHTPSTPSTPNAPLSSIPSSSTTPTSSSLPPSSTPSSLPPFSTPSSSRHNRLAQAEKFSMAAPKVIDAPKLATPISNNSQSSITHSPLDGCTLNGDEPLTVDIFCVQMERITADLERANSILASAGSNGN